MNLTLRTFFSSFLLLFGELKVNSSRAKTISAQAFMPFSKDLEGFYVQACVCVCVLTCVLALGDVFDASLGLISLLFRTSAGLSGCCPVCVKCAPQLRSGPFSLLCPQICAAPLDWHDTAGRLESGASVCVRVS